MGFLPDHIVTRFILSRSYNFAISAMNTFRTVEYISSHGIGVGELKEALKTQAPPHHPPLPDACQTFPRGFPFRQLSFPLSLEMSVLFIKDNKTLSGLHKGSHSSLKGVVGLYKGSLACYDPVASNQ